MTIQKIKEIAYNLIENNQDDYNIKDDKEKLLYILAFNDGVNALARELGMELNKEDEKDTQTEEQEEVHEDSEMVVLKFLKGTLKKSEKDYIVYRKDWFKIHYADEIDMMFHDPRYIKEQEI